jgi:hypothetical protein
LAAAHSKVAMERQKGGTSAAGGCTTPPRRNSPVHFRKMTTPSSGVDSSHTMVEMATTMGSLDEELAQQRKRSISDVFEANITKNILAN